MWTFYDQHILYDDSLTLYDWTGHVILAITETISLIENLVANSIMSVSLQDSITLSELLAAGQSYKIYLTETITLMENLKALQHLNVTLIEALSILDSLKSMTYYHISESEAIQLTDLLNTEEAYHLAVQELIHTTDSLVTQSHIKVVVADAITLLDKIYTWLNIRLSETVHMTDSERITWWIELTELINLLDQLKTQTGYTIFSQENINLLDMMRLCINQVSDRWEDRQEVWSLIWEDRVVPGEGTRIERVIPVTNRQSRLSNDCPTSRLFTTIVSETITMSDVLKTWEFHWMFFTETISSSDSLKSWTAKTENSQETITMSESVKAQSQTTTDPSWLTPTGVEWPISWRESWEQIIMNNTCRLEFVTFWSWTTFPTCNLYNSSHTLVATTAISGNVATFSTSPTLTQGNTYYITVAWWTNSVENVSWMSYPIDWDNLNYTAWAELQVSTSTWFTDTSFFYAIQSITTLNPIIVTENLSDYITSSDSLYIPTLVTDNQTNPLTTLTERSIFYYVWAEISVNHTCYLKAVTEKSAAGSFTTCSVYTTWHTLIESINTYTVVWGNRVFTFSWTHQLIAGQTYYVVFYGDGYTYEWSNTVVDWVNINFINWAVWDIPNDITTDSSITWLLSITTQ